ncbi:alkaline phosphatase PhoX [Algibacter sp. 2305UL17-15]|uniref:alkaline phosphatase PhoX n=1 Tax=Algibacter sp. 2305UL17-15 TaxID=3231268 RepID=UPI00345A7A7C
MKTTLHFFLAISLLGIQDFCAQNINDFISVNPTTTSEKFVIPSSHTFQVIGEVGDVLTEGGVFKPKPDFTGYVPIANSSVNGYLSVNSEDVPPPFGNGGGVMVFDINYNGTTKLWETAASEDLDFTAVGNTGANCSGTVTTWGTVISCEEASIPDIFPPNNGYNDLGWNVEINPATKTVVGKHYAMGSFAHENVTIHANERTVYQGADSDPGYLYKFVADTAQDFSSGNLYVFKGLKDGAGSWILLANSNQAEQNSTLAQSGTSGVDATVFNGIEDVEIGPDGWVYFAVKGFPEERVYRFQDSDPISGTAVTSMETFVGGMNYDINDGTNTTSVPWGLRNDNLAFDGDGNLWVLQDGGNNYIWVVKNGHTQASPDVEIFGIAPIGSEPTGITFTPDYKYLFMSIQHPDSGNVANQIDAAGQTVNFDKGTTLVIALNENLGTSLSVDNEEFNSEFQFYPNPVNGAQKLKVKGNNINNIKLYSIEGKQLIEHNYNALSEVEMDLKHISVGLYILKVNDLESARLVVN